MGHQVQIYLLPEDTLLIEKYFMGSDNAKFIQYCSPSAEIAVSDTLAVQEMGKSWLPIFIVREKDLKDLEVKHIEAQSYWTIDSLRSPVIEFSRCFFDGNVLRKGRLFFDLGYYGRGGEWVSKSDAFTTWADDTLRWIRKTFTRIESGAYIGKKAGWWVQQRGGRLVD